MAVYLVQRFPGEGCKKKVYLAHDELLDKDVAFALIKSASGGQPLVIILDNLHWADKPTLLLLEFLAPELGAIGEAIGSRMTA